MNKERKIVVPHLEWHVADSCNFSCEGCAHFSNLNSSRVMSLEELEVWYKTWSIKLVPKRLAILGGEPLLNKKIVDIIYLTKEYWNDPRIEKYELATNAALLYKYDKVLPKAMKETNFNLHISIHDTTPAYKNFIEPQIKLAASWANEYGIKVFLEDSTKKTWKRLFINEGYDILPYDSQDYETSWNNCPAGQDCFQLYDNKIFKCAPLTYLNTIRHKLTNQEAWEFYSKYDPLDESATIEEIEEFYSRKAEPVCAMCPNKEIYFEGNKNVLKKVIKIKNESM